MLGGPGAQGGQLPLLTGPQLALAILERAQA